MKYEIVSIDSLKPLEKVFPTHLKNLEKMINIDGFVLKAIIADKKTGIILDGSHRYVYFLKCGFKEVPVCWIDYNDENVRVGTHLGHRFLIEGTTNISKKECRERALAGNLFDPRTTRHFFPFRKTDISLPLSVLKRAEVVDVKHLIADIDIPEEIAHNRKYIKEINEEVEIVIQYLSEVSQTKQYLTEQIERMENKEVAFFPGKFHPPHLGHLKTILSLARKYNKIIVGVSEHIPNDPVINVDNIIAILQSLFENYDNLEVVLIKGILIKKSNTNGLPKFDVLLSGNPDVLLWAKNLGIKVEYVPRAEGGLFRGTEIRDELQNS